MSAKTRYEVHGWMKTGEEDSYEHGCLSESGTVFSGPDSWHGSTVDDVIEQLRAFVPFTTDEDAVERDACEDLGRIDISGTETADGDEPTSAQLEAWKKGEERLWYVTYTFQLERVTREQVSAIDVPPVVLGLQQAAALALEHAAAEAQALADLQHCPHCREALTAGDRTIGTCGHCRGQLPTEPWQTERQP